MIGISKTEILDTTVEECLKRENIFLPQNPTMNSSVLIMSSWSSYHIAPPHPSSFEYRDLTGMLKLQGR